MFVRDVQRQEGIELPQAVLAGLYQEYARKWKESMGE
jgi:hypothetical protein